MTSAPDNLLAVRKLLLAHLDIDKTRARSIDLESAEVGIVGDPDHRGGYHCGSDRVRRVDGVIRDYSVTESSRDRNGLTLAAAALDVGMFEVTVGGRTYDLPHFSAWCVGQCRAGAPDARDLREIIWSPDGRTVRRWDALGIRSTGDDSHRWHTHFSFFRDAIKAGRDLTPLFRRYLTYIGLIEGDDMSATAEKHIAELHAALLGKGPASYPASVVQQIRDVAWVLVKGPAGSGAWVGGALTRIAEASGISPAELEQITAAAREGVASAADEFAAAVLAKLDGADGSLTREDVEQAVRDAFAGGLAPETTPQS